MNPVPPYGPERLPPFFVIFLFRAAAVAETARAAIAKRENFMVAVVELWIGLDLREF